jgi:two-component system, response regulator
MENKEVEILLVEDSEADIEMMLRSLNEYNVCNAIQVARDGREALDLLFAGRDGAEGIRPRVVFLDLKLPKVSGHEVLRRMKSDEKTREIPVVVMTSSGQQADIDRCYEMGANSYVVKPIGFQDFSRVVKELKLYWLVMNQPPSQKDQ